MFDPLKKTATEAVRDAMESGRLRLREICNPIGKTPSTLHNWLHDECNSGCTTTTLLAFLNAVGLDGELTIRPSASPPELSPSVLNLLRAAAMDRPQPTLREDNPTVRHLHRLGLIYPTEYGVTERGWALVGKMLEKE